MVFGERYSTYGKNGAIKYITHLDKFSYFPKHYNFHETMLYSQQWCSRKYLGTGAVQNISSVLFLEREH